MTFNFCNASINPNILYLLIILGVTCILYFCFCKKSIKGGNKTKEEVIFILYYVDWCPHCQVIKPEWEKLENDTSIKNVQIKKLNCDNDPKLAEEKEIQGFPTIQLEYINGTVKPYNCERNLRGFKDFLNNELN